MKKNTKNPSPTDALLALRAKLEAEHGTKDHPKADILWNKACTNGHLNGLDEIRICYEDLMDLLSVKPQPAHVEVVKTILADNGINSRREPGHMADKLALQIVDAIVVQPEPENKLDPKPDSKPFLQERVLDRLGAVRRDLDAWRTKHVKSAFDAFEWCDNAMQNAATEHVFNIVHEALQNPDSTVAYVKNYVTAMVQKKAQYPRHSSSPASNVMAAYELAAWSTILDMIMWS